LKQLFYVYLIEGIRPYHEIKLPGTFEEYLSKFSSRKRGNLKRRVKKLNECNNGNLKLVTIKSTDQITAFLDSAESIAENSWKLKPLGVRIKNNEAFRDRLIDSAKRGLLRSYILLGEKPLAFVLGYQFNDIYHYVEIAYDQVFAKYSPGTVLLYMIIEDLINDNSPKKVNFGIGDATFKKEFGNVHEKDASILLLRKKFKNRFLFTSHSLFRSGVILVKKIYKSVVLTASKIRLE